MPMVLSINSSPKNIFIIGAFLGSSILFPLVGWLSVVSFFHVIELIIGYRAPLVGAPQEIDLGAILVAFIYFLLSSLFVKFLLSKKRARVALIVGCLSIPFTYHVFIMVSSLIWL